jgi:hypothetical protein
VFDRGRGDTVDTDETIGGRRRSAFAVESAARGLGRSGARHAADSDQRLINPTDGYFKNTALRPKRCSTGAARSRSHGRRARRGSSPAPAAHRGRLLMQRDIAALIAFIDSRHATPHAMGPRGERLRRLRAGRGRSADRRRVARRS